MLNDRDFVLVGYRKGQGERDMKYHKNVYRSLAMITQFGINMLVPIFACSFIGIFLDRYLGTSFFMILFFFIGALAGGRNSYIFSKKIFCAAPDRDIRPRPNSRGDLNSSDTSRIEKTDDKKGREHE